jgi:hypothetical protein
MPAEKFENLYSRPFVLGGVMVIVLAIGSKVCRPIAIDV